MHRRIPKPLLIILTAVLILALTAGILFLIFPHIPAYFRYRNTVVDETMSEYPFTAPEVPADFAERIVYGITVKAPADCINPKESRIAPFKSDTLIVTVFSGDDSVDYPEGEDDRFTLADYQHFFETVGEKMPETTEENIVFLRDKLTAKTCLTLRGTDYEIFEKMAESKEIITKMETPYFYHGSNFDGLICEMKGGKLKGTNVFISDLQHHRYATVMIRCDSSKLTQQIIAGLDVSAFPAGNENAGDWIS